MTTAHDVVTALVALGESVTTNVQVLDGDTMAEDLEKSVLVIGNPPAQAESPAVTVVEVLDEGSLDDTALDVAVACSTAVWDGEMEFTVKRGEVYDILASIRQGLAADRHLGGIAYSAWLQPDHDLFQVSSDVGTKAQIDFTITVRLFVPAGG